jgi:hypothetical protein
MAKESPSFYAAFFFPFFPTRHYYKTEADRRTVTNKKFMHIRECSL